jgi:alkylation response protein AidB-like acyl-CoA dehydrogenase
MDFNFSEIQLHWRKAAADFVVSCSPPPADGASGAHWLERAVADSRRTGVFDCALALESGDTGFDLLAICLVVEELARLDTGFCVAFLNRSLCYRAASFFMSQQVRRSFAEALRTMPAPVGAVLIWPDANSNDSPSSGTTVTLADSQLRIDEVISLAQPDTTFCLGWAPSADSKADGAIGFLASGNSVAPSIEPASVDGFRTLPVNRITGLLYNDGPNTRIHCSEALDFAQLLASAGAERALLFAATEIGLAQVALDYALDYSRTRIAFDKPLCQHQAVALRLAEVAIRIKSARILLWAACERGPLGTPDPKQAAQCWNYCARAAADAASWACQLLGGHGFLTHHPVASWLREIHMLRLLGGQSLESESNLQ